jgi:hypothetical protein
MNTFLLDLWHDLKQKRLWPVAVLLIAATAAVPVVLAKPSEEAGETAAPTLRPAQAQLPPIEAEAVTASSDLDVFNPHDPFSQDKDRAKAPGSGSGSGSGSGGGSPKIPGLDTGGSKTSGDTGSASTGSGSGGTGDTGGGGGGGGTFWFTYEIDVKFGAIGAEKTKKGLRALDILPNERNPILVFMGMKDDSKTALFMVLDPGVEASGEGSCTPSDDECSFVELTVKENRDEIFLNSSRGEDYSLQLLRVKRVKIDAPPEDQKAGDARASSRNRSYPNPFFLPHLLARAAGE